jgi:hypothetical protein
MLIRMLIIIMPVALLYIQINLLGECVVVPLLKNKYGDTSDVNNYRATALSNRLRKRLEKLMLIYLQSFDTIDNVYQFGFRKNILSVLIGCIY